jgi:hypothetical protein
MGHGVGERRKEKGERRKEKGERGLTVKKLPGGQF